MKPVADNKTKCVGKRLGDSIKNWRYYFGYRFHSSSGMVGICSVASSSSVLPVLP